MRMVIGILSLVAAIAQSNSASGTWKLNVEQSRYSGALPVFVHQGIMRLPQTIFRGGRSAAGTTSQTPAVFQFDIAPDGRTLTLSQPAAESAVKLVFERMVP